MLTDVFRMNFNFVISVLVVLLFLLFWLLLLLLCQYCCYYSDIVVIWEFAGKKLIIKLSVAASWQSEVLPWLINKLWNSL